MPSIDDVFNQLVTANTNLAKIDQGIQQLVTLETVTAQGLLHLVQQGDTMICILEHVSQNTCGTWTETHFASELQRKIEKNVALLADLQKSALPAAALELERMTRLKEQLLECCPAAEPPPICAYQPCDKPAPLRISMPGR